MLNLMRCLLLAILLVAPIVCPTSEMFTSRRDRSSYIDTSDINPEQNSQLLVDSKNRDNRSKESYIHPKNAESYTDINARIKDIFKLTEGEGTIIFDNTFTTDTGPAGANEHDDYFDMHADDPMIGKVSSTSSSFSSSSSLSSSLLSPSSSLAAAIPNSAETFKVQRTSDGKLNVVFNEFLSLQTTTKGASDIVYPGKWRTTTPPPQPTAEPIFHCKDVDAMQKGFCTEVEHYPEIPKIENILKREYSSFFGEDIQQPQNISQRSNAPDEIALCETKERVIYPKAAQNSESNWLYIVNEKEYRQGIKIEECIEEGVKCQYTEGLPINKRAYCKQHYNYRQLVAIQDNNTVVKDSFRMPSCCKCVVKTERTMG